MSDMQDIIESQKKDFERLYLRVEEIEAERNSIQKDLQALRLLAAQSISPPRWFGLPVATVSALVVISLSFILVYHNAFSNVNNSGQAEESLLSLHQPANIMRADHLFAGDTDLSAQPARLNTRFNRNKTVSQQQWGPLLVMPAPDKRKAYYGYDPLVKAQQQNLLILGFDIGEADGYKGARTQQAFAEFRALYLADSAVQLQDAELAVIMDSYANLARSDAAEFGIDHGVVAAIRLSSVRTGVDFAYLMKLAATESNFEPASESATSSATGLYQFTHDTWLNTLKTHGAKYGLVADYAKNIKYKATRSGYQRPVVRNDKLYKHLLALRKNPRLSAMMAAETTRDSQQTLAQLLNRQPTETDLYLTHFLGDNAAITFLTSLEQNPAASAAELFPEAAQSNNGIFHQEPGEPSTLNDVYAYFGEKFNTQRYGDYEVNSSLWLAKY
ncbi:MAG: transglycosylase SLT domain-containing protein [Gammaproteobacteria bacterium]